MDERPGKKYWAVIEPIWEKVSIYDDPDIFELSIAKLPEKQRHLFAAHWCQSEVRNGGFHQFFTNPTGILAPEALAAYRAIGIEPWAELVEEAIHFFGEPYPRSRATRQKLLSAVKGDTREEWDPFHALDDKFYAWLKSERGRWEAAADAYATAE